MSRTAPGARRTGSRLFVAYAAASLVPVIALGAVLAHGFRQDAVERGLDHGRAQAAVIEEMAIAPALSGHEPGAGLSAYELARLRSATDLAIFNGSVARLRVRSFTGQVVFSDDGTTVGAVPSSDPAFREAAVGGTSVEIVPDSRSGQVIRVLQPIVASTNGRASGVLEVYLPYDTIAASVHEQMVAMSRRLAGGLGLLYGVLALISWYTTRRLRRVAAQREHQALHDHLTGLPNREWFRLRSEEAVEAARRGEHGAVVLVDLDHFKEVNDSLGHHAGDELLRVVARRLSNALRTDDTVARLGGDEFGLILPQIPDEAAALTLLTRVREAVAAPIELDGLTVRTEASFGVALCPRHGTDVETLLKRADAAMYEGKRAPSGVVVYRRTASREQGRSLVVQDELRRALDRDELCLHYQPKIALDSGVVCGVEALVRWAHPDRGLLPPRAFLPAVERSGLIGPLTAWVLRRALTEQQEWTARGLDWVVAVNVSARNLEAGRFPTVVSELLDELAVPPARLVVEVTETALAADQDAAAAGVQALAERGIAIAIDDFGMGYTSLSQLRTLPVAEVKIDRSFVSGTQAEGQDRAIVASVVDLAHGLGASATAEGVETAAVAQWLSTVGCDAAQGYYYARPAPWPELMARLSVPGGADSRDGTAARSVAEPATAAGVTREGHQP
ncbi:MAG TPA: EAL domain-containing protein [Actinomycetes bacterium]|nr:EAL domain-containing protein [Actinomycetes bacterium]